MLVAMPPDKAAVHFRELRKIPGTLPPGFTLRAIANSCANPAVANAIPGSQKQKPGSIQHETRQSTAPELEVEPEIEPEGFEPEGALALKSVLTKLKTEPESTVPNASVSGAGNKPPFSRKTPNPAKVETEAERIERLEANKQRQLRTVEQAKQRAANGE